MDLPPDEGDVVPCTVLDKSVALAAGHDAEAGLAVGTNDFRVKDGRIERCEAERDERMEGR